MPKCYEGQGLGFRTLLWVLLGSKWIIALEYLALYSNIDPKFEVRSLNIQCTLLI